MDELLNENARIRQESRDEVAKVVEAFGWQLFMDGYNACIKGADLADMQTADEIAGWWYARTPHAANDVTVDADFIRHGGS